ncbi:MAG: SufD family Fe-S cluster assembly protein, partial [Sporomusaceae bacterium]|nr:SufD family Fe-S cluster assembly protein [Sporomusaceae bacterium]
GIAELEVTQTQGGAKTIRQTEARLSQKAGLTILERLSTSLTQFLESSLDIDLAADDATAQVTLRSVAQQQSKQFFDFKLDGNAKCRGAVECNSIILDEAEVSYNPKITSFNADAQLLQNTTIGKISSDQLTKLMCWGLTENEAKNTILQGFLN